VRIEAATTELAQGAVACAKRSSVSDAIVFCATGILLMIQAATGYETPFTLGQISPTSVQDILQLDVLQLACAAILKYATGHRTLIAQESSMSG